MYSLFEELYGNESTETARKLLELEALEVPALEMPEGKPSAKFVKQANSIMDADFTTSIVGDSLPTSANPEYDEQLDRMFKRGGQTGEKLRKYHSVSTSLTEAMKKMIKQFEEFFSVDDKRLLDKAVNALDITAFFNLFELRVYQE